MTLSTESVALMFLCLRGLSHRMAVSADGGHALCFLEQPPRHIYREDPPTPGATTPAVLITLQLSSSAQQFLTDHLATASARLGTSPAWENVCDECINLVILQAHGRLLEEYSTEGVATLPTPVIDSKPQLEASGAVPVVLRLGIRRKSFPLTAPRGNIPVVLVVGIGTEHCVSRPFEVAAKRNKGPTLKRKLPLLVVKSADIQSWEVEMSRQVSESALSAAAAAAPGLTPQPATKRTSMSFSSSPSSSLCPHLMGVLM